MRVLPPRLCVLCVSPFAFFALSLALPLRIPCPENFFQSLENRRKIFPIVGKTGRNFPTIGNFFSNHWKNRPKFSNHWKKIFQSLEKFSRARQGAHRNSSLVTRHSSLLK